MKVSAKGIAEKIAQIKGVIARARDISAALEVGQQDIKTLVFDAFSTGRDPSTGDDWAPLAASTIAKRRVGKGKKQRYTTLVDTGTLRNSVATRVEGDQIVFGTNVPYGVFHQSGTRKMPQRRFLPGDNGTFSFASGSPAEKTYSRIMSRIRNWVLTGKPVAT